MTCVNKIRTFFVCFLLALLLPTAWAQTNAPALPDPLEVATGMVPTTTVSRTLVDIDPEWAAELQESWMQHLTFRLGQEIPGTDAFEALCISALGHDPGSAFVVTNLVRHFFRRGEFVLAVSTAAYGETVGVKTRSQRLAETWARLKVPFERQDDHHIYVTARMEQLGPVEALKIPIYTPDYFAYRESHLRILMKHELEVVQLLYMLAETWSIRPEPELAVMLTTALIQLDPGHQKGVHLHLKLLEELGIPSMYESLIHYYLKIKKRPDFLNRELGDISFRLGAFDEAEGFYKAWLAKDSGSSDALQKVGETFYRRKRFDEAKTYLLRASIIPERDPEVFRLLALIAAHEDHIGAMAEWLGQLRPFQTDDEFLALLQSPYFRRFPELLGRFPK